MICLEVSRNGTRLCLAGLREGMCNLDIMVGNPPHTPPTLYVGGIRGEEPIESVEWVREEIALGDVVSFRMVEAENPDLPHLTPPMAPGFAEACDLSWAQKQHEDLTDRLRELEARWGDQLGKSPDA